MIEFAERAFALGVLQEEGVSLREVLKGQLGRTKDPRRISEIEAELALPPFPEELAFLWKAYNRIRGRKGGGMGGVMPIEWPDIDAFTRNSRLALTPWEVEVIEALDDVYVRVER